MIIASPDDHFRSLFSFAAHRINRIADIRVNADDLGLLEAWNEFQIDIRLFLFFCWLGHLKMFFYYPTSCTLIYDHT